MPLPIDVSPYALDGVIGGDNYLTHYKATKDDGELYVITEFYPAYMVKREDDGTLGISERFSKEFIADRDEFIKRAQGFQEVRDASLQPVVEIFERNHTAYVVRRLCGLTGVDQYMGSATMDYDEAYFFVRPLLTSMAVVSEKGMLFTITNADFRVNAQRQLVLCAPPSWDSDFHKPLIQITRLYYRLVTGVEPPEQGAPAFSAYGIEVPPRIETLVMEILGGDILYGSLNDFYKKFKSLIDGTKEADQDSGKKTLAAMRVLVAALFVIFVVSLAGLTYSAVHAHRESTFWANPQIFAEYYVPPPPVYDFSDITLTHPRNTGDALTGSFANYYGFTFFRKGDGLNSRLTGDIVFIPGATGMAALAGDRLIVPDAVPSFIVGHGGYIYFVDSASYGAIYRANTSGNYLTRITQYAALNLAVMDDFLFYTASQYNHSLWRYDILNSTHQRVNYNPVRAVHSYGSHLFFIEEDAYGTGLSLYSWDTYAQQRIRVSAEAVGNLRTVRDTLFYLTHYGRVRSVTFDGRPIATHPPQNVRTFDAYYQWIFFTEEGTHMPRAYNMDNGRLLTLSGTEWVSYLWAFDGLVYGIDHMNPTLVHYFSVPSW